MIRRGIIMCRVNPMRNHSIACWCRIRCVGLYQWVEMVNNSILHWTFNSICYRYHIIQLQLHVSISRMSIRVSLDSHLNNWVMQDSCRIKLRQPWWVRRHIYWVVRSGHMMLIRIIHSHPSICRWVNLLISPTMINSTIIYPNSDWIRYT